MNKLQSRKESDTMLRTELGHLVMKPGELSQKYFGTSQQVIDVWQEAQRLISKSGTTLSRENLYIMILSSNVPRKTIY